MEEIALLGKRGLDPVYDARLANAGSALEQGARADRPQDLAPEPTDLFRAANEEGVRVVRRCVGWQDRFLVERIRSQAVRGPGIGEEWGCHDSCVAREGGWGADGR